MNNVRYSAGKLNSDCLQYIYVNFFWHLYEFSTPEYVHRLLQNTLSLLLILWDFLIRLCTAFCSAKFINPMMIKSLITTNSLRQALLYLIPLNAEIGMKGYTNWYANWCCDKFSANNVNIAMHALESDIRSTKHNKVLILGRVLTHIHTCTFKV